MKITPTPEATMDTRRVLGVDYAQCPKCESYVTLHDGNYGVHARHATLGPGSRKCSNGGKPHVVPA
jgi:hypothetical protein